jgi:hypothetical protein
MFSSAYRAVRTFFDMRGARVVKCPETLEPAGVVVDALHAGTTAFSGAADLRLRSCSRWPERSSCGQQCVRQIETAPADCLVKNILKKWSRDKQCALCKESLNDVDWVHERAVLMRPDGTIAEWYEFRPEQIPAALQTHLPVCWSCYLEEEFRSQHPELF